MLNKYNALNNSFKRKVIFFVGCDAGFFSEFNNMVLAMLYCLKEKIKFSIYSDKATFAYKEGWNDFFLPFCEETRLKFHKKYNTRFPNNNKLLKKFLLKKLYRFDYFTCDIWNDFREGNFRNEILDIPELEVNGSIRESSRKIIDMIWRYQPNVKKEISDIISKLNLPSEYVGFHIRGGDKFQECEIQAVDAYIDKASKLTDIKNAFVLTDDYRVILSLRKNYPDWKFYTICQEDERGYFHDEFIQRDKEYKRSKIINLLASMDILKNSQVFIGTFSSNIGMFLGMCMDKDKCFGIDFDEWQFW